MTLTTLLVVAAALPIAGYGSTVPTAEAMAVADPAMAGPALREIEPGDSASGDAVVAAPGLLATVGGAPLPESPVSARAAAGAGTEQGGSTLFFGSVRDPSGKPIRGANLTLIARESGDARQIVTDATGTFRFEQLPAGVYELLANAAGFAQKRTSLTLSDGQVIERAFALTLGGAVQSMVIRPGGDVVAGEPVEQAAPAAAVPCTNAGVSCMTPARLIAGVRPLHPGVSGVVILEGAIGLDGTISHARVLRTPHPDLSRATLEAVKQWLYQPLMLNGIPTMTIVTVTVSFE